jgi:hypothetical protein
MDKLKKQMAFYVKVLLKQFKAPLLIGMLDIYNSLWAYKVTTKSMPF